MSHADDPIVIVAAARTPLGRYLGDNKSDWMEYDAVALVQSRGWHDKILIDQGEADEFLLEQLRPELFQTACANAGVDLQLRMQPGYDHSYFFIASFMADHMAHHAKALNG